MAPQQSFEQFLQTTLTDFPFEGEVFHVSTEQTVNEATKLLGEKGYLSAPIWDEAAAKYCGFYDVTEGLTIVFTVDTIASILPSNWLDEKAVKTLPDKEKEIKVKDLLFDAENNSTDIAITPEWCPLKSSSSLLEALKFLSNTKSKRIPVVSAEGNLEKLITLSKITSHIDKYLKNLEANLGDGYMNNLPKLFSTTVKDLPGLKKANQIVKVEATEPVREAFLKILDERVSAVAVVDEDGMLLSSISDSDVRMFPTLEEIVAQRAKDAIEGEDEDAETFKGKSLMEISCEDFIKLVQDQFHHQKTTKIPHISVGEDCTLRRIISKLAFTRKHRVWVTDSVKNVVSVVSVSDVARLLVMANDSI